MPNCQIVKKILCLTISMFILLMCLTSCKNFGKELQLNDVVNNILVEKGIEKSKITFLCEATEEISALYNYKVPEVTTEELNKYVEDLLLSHAKMIEVTDRKIVQENDVIIVSYVVYFNSKIVANAENEPLMVGSGNYGEEFESAVLGAIVGEPFSCELNSPVDTEKYKKGDMLKYNITVESINYFESYYSSDRYILDYYGCQTEDDFFNECKIRLRQIKTYENQSTAYDEFLGEVAEECSFYIDKEEAAAYSRKIVDEHKNLAYISGMKLSEYIEEILDMNEDAFYDYCYNEGVKEIKQYLLVGASTHDIDINTIETFPEFCSISGYDSTVKENLQAKYAFLKRSTVFRYRPNVRQVVGAVAHKVHFNSNKKYTVDIYESSNIYAINLSLDKEYPLSSEIQHDIITEIKDISFSGTIFNPRNQLYQTALIIKEEGGIVEKLFIDEINGYLKWQQRDGNIVVWKTTTEFTNLIKSAKQG